MKIGQAFPSKYLKASDFEDGDRALTIAKIEMEEVGSATDKSTKPVIYFKGEEKGFVANKTNCTTISKVLGSDDTDDWVGQRITLRQAEVEFQGEMVMSIRVSLKRPAAPAPKAKPSQEAEEPSDAMPSADDF